LIVDKYLFPMTVRCYNIHDTILSVEVSNELCTS